MKFTSQFVKFIHFHKHRLWVVHLSLSPWNPGGETRASRLQEFISRFSFASRTTDSAKEGLLVVYHKLYFCCCCFPYRAQLMWTTRLLSSWNSFSSSFPANYVWSPWPRFCSGKITLKYVSISHDIFLCVVFTVFAESHSWIGFGVLIGSMCLTKNSTGRWLFLTWFNK